MIAVIKNFKEVIETRNIDKMNKELYQFLNLYCGFIAHYDINGFKATYRDPRDFTEVFIRHFDPQHRYYQGIYSCHQEPYKDTGLTKAEIKKEFERIIVESKCSLDPAKRKYSYMTNLVIKKYDIQNKDEILKNSVKLFWEQIIKDLIIIPKTFDVLEKLREKFRFVVASDEFLEILEKKLRKTIGNWENFFEFLATPELANTMKPSKKYYEIILKKTKIKPGEVIIVGDSWGRDLEPAKSLKIKTVLISRKKEGCPDFWIKNIEEILEIIDGL